MSAPLPPKPKRTHSRSPNHSPIRRVRQRIGSISINVVPKKRDESPEEGEVEETANEPSISRGEDAVNGASSANGFINGSGSKEDEGDNKEKTAAGAGGKAKGKVAFPFKSRAAKVQAIPTVDMENAPPSRSTMPLISPTKREYTRGGGGGGPRHGGEETGGGRDSYVPSYSRGADSYVPSRDRDRGSPRGGYERRRSWSPPYRDDGPDTYRRGRSRSPVESWDSYVAPKYQDPAARIHKGRLMDTYVPPPERSPNRPSWQRSSSRGRGGGDYHRTHADSPPRERSPSERGFYSRTERYSPGPAPHRLPPRPPSPDRYAPPRYDDRSWNSYGSRDQDWDRGYYPPRTPTRSPPPLSDVEMGTFPSDGPPAPRVSFSRHGNGAAVLLQQQQQQQQQQQPQPLPLPPRPPVPPVVKPQAVYTRPAPAPAPPPPAQAEVVDPKHEVAPPTPNERQEKAKTSSHKVARVRTKEEERLAYGREFVGSGRINEYFIMNKLGEGTFGEVHRARLRNAPESGSKDLALKKIIMHSEKDGMPITALREIKILKALNHPNIVKVLDIVVMPRTPNVAGSVYMVFPYMDHDLAGLLDNKAVQLAQSHIKLYMKQLLEGLEHMHENHIIHRDIKAANILISNEGVLQIADFGLARTYVKKSKKERLEESKKHGRMEKYTNCVVTRWYRPPELLLGERLYGAEIDLWGVGCILAEMFVRRPIFQGQSDMDQLEKIWWLCGTPTRENWPDFENLPGLDGVKEFKPRPKGLRDFLGRFDSITRETMDLIDSLLSLDPVKRPTASAALLHEYFWTTPLPADPKTMPKYEASHELDRRKKEAPPAPPPNPHQQSYQFQGPHGRGGAPFNNFNHHRGGGGGNGTGMGRGGPPAYRPYNPGGPYPMGRVHMSAPPGPPMHPGMQGPPPHSAPFPPLLNQQLQEHGPPPMANSHGLPPPRGFRPPPPPRVPFQQPSFAGNYGGRPPGPNNGPPPGMPGGPPRDRGPPPPPNDSVVLHYG